MKRASEMTIEEISVEVERVSVQLGESIAGEEPPIVVGAIGNLIARVIAVVGEEGLNYAKALHETTGVILQETERHLFKEH